MAYANLLYAIHKSSMTFALVKSIEDKANRDTGCGETLNYE